MPDHLLIFTLGGQPLALPLERVERVVRAVAVTPLPDAPPLVRGVINVQGQIVPVIDVRHRFNVAVREIELENQFIIARAGTRLVAMLAESVRGVESDPGRADTGTEGFLSGHDYVDGVIKREGELVLVCNLERLVTGDVAKLLDTALPDLALSDAALTGEALRDEALPAATT